MSTNARVIRNLVITSSENLAGILKNREEILVLNEELTTFIWLWDKYQMGCRCDEESNLQEVNLQYKKISQDLAIKILICQEFKCDDVEFRGI